jgi:hypothetical protein
LWIIDTAKRKPRLIVQNRNSAGKEPFYQPGAKSACFGPSGNCAGFQLPNLACVREEGCAVICEREPVKVLKEKFDFCRRLVGQEAESPEVSLAKVSKSDEPEP